MRKQTKLAILVGAMSIAGAMTSFAATGWQQENGTWVYYDKNEEKVSQKWQQSGIGITWTIWEIWLRMLLLMTEMLHTM